MKSVDLSSVTYIFYLDDELRHVPFSIMETVGKRLWHTDWPMGKDIYFSVVDAYFFYERG